MKITPEYLERFAVLPTDPIEVPLGGWEIDATASIGLDNPETQSLAVNHWDEWPSHSQWDIKEGAEKRWTYVRITNDDGVVGDVGYEFPGLVKIEDLRFWYRDRLGLPDDRGAERHPSRPDPEIVEDHK